MDWGIDLVLRLGSHASVCAPSFPGSITSVHLQEESVFRLLAEPADILMRSLTLVVLDEQVSCNSQLRFSETDPAPTTIIVV
eukprot:4273751-Amphidinium_carterae.1